MKRVVLSVAAVLLVASAGGASMLLLNPGSMTQSGMQNAEANQTGEDGKFWGDKTPCGSHTVSVTNNSSDQEMQPITVHIKHRMGHTNQIESFNVGSGDTVSMSYNNLICASISNPNSSSVNLDWSVTLDS